MSKLKAHGETIVKRVSRRHDEEGHSGSWKVAFADFCLALMCLFMVLWVLAAREQEVLKDVLKTSGGSVIDEGRGRMLETVGGPRGSLIPREPMPVRGEGGGPLAGRGADTRELYEPGRTRVRYESAAQLHELSQVLARMSEQTGLKANLQTIVTPYGLRVMLHDTDRQGMFELGSAVPSERFRQLLRQMGPLFAQVANPLLIVGHTDARQYTDARAHAMSNWVLSSNRAAAARAHLMDGGMPAESVLQVVGMAERAPLVPHDPLASANRRIELLVMTEAQAQAIAAMFSQPTDARPLWRGADSELPSRGVLDTLRDQLLQASQNLPGLQPRPVTPRLPAE